MKIYEGPGLSRLCVRTVNILILQINSGNKVSKQIIEINKYNTRGKKFNPFNMFVGKN